MKIIMILIIMTLTGCGMKGTMDKDQHMTCTDTRDGEVFSYSSNNVSNVVVYIDGDVSADIVTDAGKKMHVTKSMEVYIKCEKTK